jgi:hypothetical protein
MRDAGDISCVPLFLSLVCPCTPVPVFVVPAKAGTHTPRDMHGLLLARE